MLQIVCCKLQRIDKRLIMSKINNPFVMYGYKGEDYFCDRKQESQTIEKILYNGNHVSVISPRRMVKTGLVHHVFLWIVAQVK